MRQDLVPSYTKTGANSPTVKYISGQSQLQVTFLACPLLWTCRLLVRKCSSRELHNKLDTHVIMWFKEKTDPNDKDAIRPVCPSGSEPIKATRFRRIATLTAVSILRRLGSQNGQTLMLPGGICIKYSEWADLGEASSMEFIRHNTSIPIPKIYCAFKHKKHTYIVMERVKGHIIGSYWLERSEDSRTRLLAQLKHFVDEMRALQPPGPGIANANGGSLHDLRLPGLWLDEPVCTAIRFGPFEDIPAFHRWLTKPFDQPNDTLPAESNDLIKQYRDTDWGQPVFTHGDLNCLNILVDGEKITGIIDWETAGWYPSYWEYTTAHQMNIRNLFWYDYIDRFLEPRPKELEMDRSRQYRFGLFGFGRQACDGLNPAISNMLM